MFGIKKENLIKNLKLLRQKLCCYLITTEKDRCDCKYLSENMSIKDIGGNTENTGCCELREVISILEQMKDKDFDKLCKKAGLLL